MPKSFLSDNESLVKKASLLTLGAEKLASGMKNGNFKSLYKGHGIEVNGVRDYIRGDDVRSLDWNVTARMGKPFVKVFEEQKELQTFLVVDSSDSMLLETGRKTKYEEAAEAAALVTLASEINGCPVGGVFFDGEIHFSSKPRSGRNQSMLLLQHLDRLSEIKTKGSSLGTALNGAGKLLKQRSLIFIFSDFRTGEWEKPLIALSQKHDIIAVRVHDKYDDELPSLGSVIFEDIESGIRMTLPTSSSKFKKQWNDYHEQKIALWQEICQKHGIIPVILKTVDDPLYVLNNVFSKKIKG